MAQAVPQSTRDPITGQMKVVYVDPTTGLPVSGDYQVQNPNSFLSLDALGINPLKEPEKPQNTGQEIVQEIRPTGSERDSSGGFAGTAAPRDQSNNYGYYDKPGWMGALGMAPGMLGLAGKAVNAGINLGNVEAIKAAQDTMDVPETGFGGTVKGIVRDNKGFVGDYGINNQKYSVGLEAIDPFGRTTLTPEEARERGLITGTGVTPLSKPEAKAARKGFAEEFPDAKPKGVLGRAMSSIGDFLGSFLGDSDEDSFPDAPSQAAPSFSDMQSRGFGRSGSGAGFGSGQDASEAEASRGGGGVTSGGGGLW